MSTIKTFGQLGDVKLPGPSEEFRPFLPAMCGILDNLGSSSRNVFVDYGSGPGVWSLCASNRYRSVYGIDIDETMLSRARELNSENQIENVELLNLREADIDAIPAADAIISVGVIELAHSVDVLRMFEFAASRLRPGGEFLCMTRPPIGALGIILSLQRFRWDGFWLGAKRTAAFAKSAIEAFVAPEIRPIHRARFYHRASTIGKLANRHGLVLKKSVNQLYVDDSFIDFEPYCAPRFLGFRTIDWHLFEKPESND